MNRLAILFIVLFSIIAEAGFGPKTFITPQEAIEMGIISSAQINYIKSAPAVFTPLPAPFRLEGELTGYIDLYTTEGLYPAHQSNLSLQPLADGMVVIDDTYYVSTDETGYWAFPDIGGQEIYVDFVSQNLTVRSMIQGSGSETVELLIPLSTGEWIDIWVDTFKLGCSYVMPADDLSLTLGYDYEYIIANSNAYYHSKATEQWIKRYLPEWEQLNITILTNDRWGACDAWYIPDANIMAFSQRQWGCPNTAYASIIRHEYGHGFICSLNEIDGDCSEPANPEFVDYNGYHEAMADLIAAYSLGTSCMGPDAFGEGTGCGRNLDDDYIWPILDDDPHVRGRPLSGAFWDLYQALLFENQGPDIAAALLLHSAIVNTSGYTPDIKSDVIDVDAWLFDGKHIDMIEEAFTSHGF